MREACRKVSADGKKGRERRRVYASNDVHNVHSQTTSHTLSPTLSTTKNNQQLLQEKPDKPVDLFEYSVLTKKLALDVKETPVLLPTLKETHAATTASLFSAPEPPINPETGEPEAAEPPNEYETENVMTDASLFEACGVGLSRSEMYRVMLAVKALGEDPVVKVATVRFFGKMLGTHADYYVFETTLKEPATPEEETPEGVVPTEVNSGVNAYTYFVTTRLGDKPVQLPDATPAAIVCARQIKKFLTGDLDAHVSAYPLFPGREAMYLRAQIARIAASTVVCPVGFFQLEGDEGTSVAKTEEYAAPETYEDVASWCYRYPHVKAQGRVEAFVFPPPEPAEGEEPAEPEEPEVSPPMLTALTEAYDDVSGDYARLVPGEEGGAPWSVVTSSMVPGVKFKVGGVKSLLWPGAAAVALGNTFANVYVGYGIKNAPFVPVPPPPVAAEFDAALVESSELPTRPDAETMPTEEEG